MAASHKSCRRPRMGASFEKGIHLELWSAGHCAVAQLRFAATQRYPLRRISMAPGIFENHTSGAAHQISRASSTAASAPPYRLPSHSRNCISFINSSCDRPSNATTRGSWSGASAMPRRSRMGTSQRATRVQNLHSASKNSQPRACRPFPSVYSLTSEIILSSLLLGFLLFTFQVLLQRKQQKSRRRGAKHRIVERRFNPERNRHGQGKQEEQDRAGERYRSLVDAQNQANAECRFGNRSCPCDRRNHPRGQKRIHHPRVLCEVRKIAPSDVRLSVSSP